MKTGTEKWPFRWFALVLAVALLTNAVFLFMSPSGGSATMFSPLDETLGESLYSAVALDEQTAVVATLSNQLIVREQGQITAQIDAPAAIFGLAYDPERDAIIVGTSKGQVLTYDRALQQLSEGKVKGNVLDLGLLSNGLVGVAHGVGAYGDRFYVSVLDATGAEVSIYQVGVRLTAADALGESTLYGTYEAQVGASAADGTPQWTAQVRREITTVRGWPEREQVLAGDVAGNVYLIDNSGNLVWEQALTQFRIGAICPIGEDLIAVGDADGGVHLLNTAGELLIAQASQNTRDPVVAIYPVGQGQAVAVRQSGGVIQLNPQALVSAQRTQTLRPIWYSLDALWFVLLIVALIYAIHPWRVAVGGLARRTYRARTAYLFLLPSLVLILLFVYLTTGMAIYYSTTDYVPGDPIRIVGLQNFKTIFTTDRYFWTGFGNMLLILVTSTLKVLTMPLMVALLVFHLRNTKAQYALRTAFILPSVVPGIVLTMMWKMMYDPGTTGFVNAVLRAVGADNLQRAWLGDERTALWAIILAGFPWVGAFSFLIYLGGLININTELFDAGAIDGVSWWGRLRFIEWPLLAPQRNLLLFFTYLGAIQSYEGIWVYTQGGPNHATYVPALQLYLNLSEGMRVGYASAIGFVLFLMVLAVTILNRRLQQRQTV